MCSPDLQNITDIIKNNLEDYDFNFLGWSGLVRRTFLKYSIPADPLQYLQYPWLPDRWRRHCKEIVVRFWDDKFREEVSTSKSFLKEDGSSKTSLKYLDVTDLSTDKIHPVYRAAGLDSLNVTKSTVVMWFLLGVFHCKSLEHKMKKSLTGQCSCNESMEEDIQHILLFCDHYLEIREQFLVELTFSNRNIVKYSNNPDVLLTSFLDPESPGLPDEIRDSWNSLDDIYKISRNYCYNIYKKCEKLNEVVIPK